MAKYRERLRAVFDRAADKYKNDPDRNTPPDLTGRPLFLAEDARYFFCQEFNVSSEDMSTSKMQGILLGNPNCKHRGGYLWEVMEDVWEGIYLKGIYPAPGDYQGDKK